MPSRRWSPARCPSALPQLVVPDALAALQDLAATVFGQAQPLTVGVTGSSGKTSTKDLLGQVLGAFGETLFPEGSFNNELGPAAHRAAPHRRDAARRAGVLGPRRRPHRLPVRHRPARRRRRAQRRQRAPRRVRVGRGASRRPRASWSRRPAGRAVLNADDVRVLGMRTRTERPVTTFGTGADADVRAEGLELDGDGRARFRLVAPQGSADVAPRRGRGAPGLQRPRRGRRGARRGHRRRRAGGRAAVLGGTRCQPVADGGRRAGRRRHRRQRRLQRQPRLDAGGAAHPGRDEPRQDAAHLGGARPDGRARRGRPAGAHGPRALPRPPRPDRAGRRRAGGRRHLRRRGPGGLLGRGVGPRRRRRPGARPAARAGAAGRRRARQGQPVGRAGEVAAALLEDPT